MLIALTVVLSTATAAPFEGVLKFKLQSQDSVGTMTTYVSKKSGRADVEMPGAEGRPPMKLRMLFDPAKPKQMTMVHEANQSYLTMDIEETQQQMAKAQQEAAPPKVEKLGKDKVMGFACQNVRLTYEDGTQAELCASKEFNQSPFFASLLKQSSRSPNRFESALKSAGVEGLALRMKTLKAGALQSSLELIEAEKKALPADTFKVPAGYTEMQQPKIDPQQLEMIRQQMEKMPPEQKKALMEMMKKQQGAAPK